MISLSLHIYRAECSGHGNVLQRSHQSQDIAMNFQEWIAPNFQLLFGRLKLHKKMSKSRPFFSTKFMCCISVEYHNLLQIWLATFFQDLCAQGAHSCMPRRARKRKISSYECKRHTLLDTLKDRTICRTKWDLLD